MVARLFGGGGVLYDVQPKSTQHVRNGHGLFFVWVFCCPCGKGSVCVWCTVQCSAAAPSRVSFVLVSKGKAGGVWLMRLGPSL